MFGEKRFRLTVMVITALILTVALAPAAAAESPPGDPPAPTATSTAVPPPPGNNPTATATPTAAPPPSSGNGGGPPPINGGEPPPINGTATPTATATPGGGGVSAPAWPPAGLIVTHAATQVQLAPVNNGLQSYLIGSDGTGHSGPWIDSFSSLAQQHAGVATLWTGTNPGTGKPVTIYYLPAENKLRISTFYPDTQYDTNKPYVFTVDTGHNVVHEQW